MTENNAQAAECLSRLTAELDTNSDKKGIGPKPKTLGHKTAILGHKKG